MFGVLCHAARSVTDLNLKVGPWVGHDSRWSCIFLAYDCNSDILQPAMTLPNSHRDLEAEAHPALTVEGKGQFPI